MRFKGLDLNLLVALDVLLDECNVSRAAERLHLSQPAVSAALRRLRDFFNDPLLTLHGKRMVPTPHAIALRPQVKQLLADAQGVIGRSTRFEPATSDRWFRICLSDYISTVLFGALSPLLQASAPAIRLDLQPPSEEMPVMLERGEIDLVLAPQQHCVPGHPTELLFEERHVVVGWRDNPLMAQPVSEQTFYSAGHVAVEIGRLTRVSFAELHLRARGRERRVEVIASSFSLVPELLVGTDRLAIMHERLARTLSTRLPIVWQMLPFDFPVMREMIQYHRTRADDPGLRWLIGKIHETALHSPN